MENINNITIDKDIIRIKNRIDILNGIFKDGSISQILNLIIGYLIKFEISNGDEKINIQSILSIFLDKITQLDLLFRNLCISINTELIYEEKNNEYKNRIEIIKDEFRIEVYKLFNLSDIFKIFIEKCFTFGKYISYNNIYNNLFGSLNQYLHELTILLVDTILFTETDLEFIKSIIKLINDRTETIQDYSDRKLEKINIAKNILETIINENDNNKIFTKEAKVHIEMAEK